MAVGDTGAHAGNDGYDDTLGFAYLWDSRVPNHKKLAPGHPIALWDKKALLGVSVIERIETHPGVKLISRCPYCSTGRIKERATLLPRYRCMKCRKDFADPRQEIVEVTKFVGWYDAAWTPLDGLISGDDLRKLQINAIDINAMRPLDWAALERTLSDLGAGRALSRIGGRMPETSWPTIWLPTRNMRDCTRNHLGWNSTTPNFHGFDSIGMNTAILLCDITSTQSIPGGRRRTRQ